MNMKAKIIKCKCGVSFGSTHDASLLKMMKHCIKEHPESPSPQRQEDPEYDLNMCLLENKWNSMRAALGEEENHENAIMQLPKLRTPYFLQDSSSRNSLSSMVAVHPVTALAPEPSNPIQETTQVKNTAAPKNTPVSSQIKEKSIASHLPSTAPMPMDYVNSKAPAKELIKSSIQETIQVKNAVPPKITLKTPVTPQTIEKNSPPSTLQKPPAPDFVHRCKAPLKESVKSGLAKLPKNNHKILPVSNLDIQAVQQSSGISSDMEEICSSIEIAKKINKPSCNNNTVETTFKDKQLDTQTREEIWDRIDIEITGKTARKKTIKLKAPEWDPEVEKICSEIPLKQNKAQSARRKTKKSESTSDTSDFEETSKSECNSSKSHIQTIHNNPMMLEHAIKQPTVRIKRLFLPYNNPPPKTKPALLKTNTILPETFPESPKRHKKSKKHSTSMKKNVTLKKLKKYSSKKKKAAIRSSGFDLDTSSPSPPPSPAKKSRKTSKEILNYTMPKPIFNADDFCNFDDDLPDL